MRQEKIGFWDGSGISWTTCKQSAPRSREITTPTSYHSIFTGRMLFLMPNQQFQSNEGITLNEQKLQTNLHTVLSRLKYTEIVISDTLY